MTSVPARLGAFMVALAVVFAAAFAVGRAAGPFDPADAPTTHSTTGHRQ